jgi:hypothetical protein
MVGPGLARRPPPLHCTHTQGHGGHKATVAGVQRRLPQFRFVLCTDVKDYYASLDHELLLEQLARRGLYYVRYMDDIVVLAPTHWTLRGAVRLGDYVTRWMRWTRAGLRELDRGGLPAACPEAQQAGQAKA